jgi:hypothetical protein
MPKLFAMKDYSREFINTVLRKSKEGFDCYRKVDVEKKLQAILARMKKRYPSADFSILTKLPNDLGYKPPELAAQHIAEQFMFAASKNRLDEFSDLEPEKPFPPPPSPEEQERLLRRLKKHVDRDPSLLDDIRRSKKCP